MNAICAGFDKPPHMCKRILETLIENNDTKFMQKQFHLMPVVLSCIFIMFLVFIVLCLYRRHAKREMKEQLNEEIRVAVGQYVALSNQDPEARSRANTSGGVLDSAEPTYK